MTCRTRPPQPLASGQTSLFRLAEWEARCEQVLRTTLWLQAFLEALREGREVWLISPPGLPPTIYPIPSRSPV